MNLDFIPSGDKQPTKIKKKHRYSHNDTGLFLSPPQRLPLSIPVKIAIHRKIKSPGARWEEGIGSPSSFSIPFPSCPARFLFSFFPAPASRAAAQPRPQCFSLKKLGGAGKGPFQGKALGTRLASTEERGPFCLRVNKLHAFCRRFRSLRSNRFRASASRELGWEQTKGMKGKKREGREGNPTFVQ